MKKVLVFTFALLASVMLRAQEVMPKVWETRLSHQIHYTGTGLEGQISYAASDKEMSVIDNTLAARCCGTRNLVKLHRNYAKLMS